MFRLTAHRREYLKTTDVSLIRAERLTSGTELLRNFILLVLVKYVSFCNCSRHTKSCPVQFY